MSEFEKTIKGISGRHDLVEAFVDITTKFYEKEREWIKTLKEQGFKAAHPNDGWVDRENNKVHLVYPQFNLGIKVGDKVMIGDHYSENRPVIITRIEKTMFDMTYYHFEDIRKSI